MTKYIKSGFPIDNVHEYAFHVLRHNLNGFFLMGFMGEYDEIKIVACKFNLLYGPSTFSHHLFGHPLLKFWEKWTPVCEIAYHCMLDKVKGVTFHFGSVNLDWMERLVQPIFYCVICYDVEGSPYPW